MINFPIEMLQRAESLMSHSRNKDIELDISLGDDVVNVRLVTDVNSNGHLYTKTGELLVSINNQDPFIIRY